MPAAGLRESFDTRAENGPIANIIPGWHRVYGPVGPDWRARPDAMRPRRGGPYAVHNHIASILAKLHLDNRIQAAVQAVRSGIA